ncbi:MAG: bifunctional diaminohydroxyphosphoribosylaminopyrimidine deaminase/5-amino-6-(5-phosphoribosylamino)uracil reductase RibD, partial [Bacteroidetes bacterium]
MRAVSDEVFMRRCFDLARLGAGRVSPNPMVGAVLVYEGRIIGEGWHRRYGGAHAEVNALASVAPSDRALIRRSTLYVSLEPCCIHRKTPPCTNLILREGIPRVVVSCLDPTPEVNGRGLELLREGGVEVRVGVLEEEGRRLIRFREAFVRHGRPFVLLKFACSRDGFLGKPGEQIWISNPWTKRWVHRCRAAADAILVGTRTARTDNPQLTTRLFFGDSPLRIVLDRRLTLPP